MRREEFLAALRSALGKLPEQDVRASLEFYAEAIDDRMEDGASEEEAVAALGDVNAIAAQIIAETPPIPKAVAKMKTGNRTANIVLAVVLSPIWVPLALVFALCVAAIYLSLWAVIVALWAVVVVLILCAPIGIAGLVYCLATDYPLTGMWLLGCGIAGSGLGLFALLGMKAVSRGLVQLTGMFAGGVKSLFVKRGGAEALKEGASSVAGDMRSAATATAAGVKKTAAAAAAGMRETAVVAAAGAKGAVAGAKAAMHEASAQRSANGGCGEGGEGAPQANEAAAPRNGAPVPPPGYVMSQTAQPADTTAEAATDQAGARCAGQPAAQPGEEEPRPKGASHDNRA